MVTPNDDERPENSATDNTRRQFVAGSAGVVGGLVAGGALSGSVLAQSDEEEPDGEGTADEETDDSTAEPTEETFEDDVAILNYALTLEYLEASFYQRGLDNISEEDLCNCKALAEDSPLRDRAYDELQTIQSQEEAHVESLRTVIQDLGGVPIDEPEFDFGVRVEYPMAFLGTAVQLEDVGVSAYAGAATHIENDSLLPPALGIHSVEARHAAFLRTLTDQTPFPMVIDEPRTRDQVLDLVAPFIVQEEASEDSEDPGTETSDGSETETSDGTETEMPDGTETEMPDGNETETSDGTETEMPDGNETETTTQ